MPTLDDLRAVLADRERYAGDPDTVLHHVAEPPRRRVLAPALAAAAVVALAAGGVALAGSDDPPAQQSGGTLPPYVASDPHWGFRVDAVDGYRSTRYWFAAESQVARVTTGDGTFAGFVTVYARDVTPKSLQLPRSGTDVTVGDRDGTFFAGADPQTTDPADDADSFPRLLWKYDGTAWAEVDGIFGYDASTGTYDPAAARTAELAVAEAVHPGTDSAVTMPFAVGTPPDGVSLATAEAVDRQHDACLGYRYAGDPPVYAHEDSALSVCRVPTAEAQQFRDAPGDGRAAVHELGDGTAILVMLAHEHLDALTQDQLDALAASVDTSPSPTDRSTWLAVH